jgi:glycosyltransferase involved in cell wall biosynthesis
LGTIVSVLLTIKNAEKYIAACLKSLLDQTYADFEIIIVDDLSNDGTKEIVETFSDSRIRYFRNDKLLGLSASRNKCLKLAIGKYVFFTDGDCIVSKNWIEEGLEYLKKTGCIGVEGKTYYVSEEYVSTRSDDVVENKNGGEYPTCTIAYSKRVLEAIGGFYDRLTYLEDRDLALRAKRIGKILFNKNMIVYHQKRIFFPKQFVLKTKIVRNRVLLYKRLKDKPFFMWRILYPMNLIAIFFPPLILRNLFTKKYKTKEDFDLLPLIYVSLIYERLNFWDMCARERVFLI